MENKDLVDAFEELGQAIDRVENLQYAIQIPMPAEFHVEQLKILLPEVVQELKDAFVKCSGENPWE